jgi:poly(3-hydroxybutyrate) depolymerase
VRAPRVSGFTLGPTPCSVRLMGESVLGRAIRSCWVIAALLAGCGDEGEPPLYNGSEMPGQGDGDTRGDGDRTPTDDGGGFSPGDGDGLPGDGDGTFGDGDGDGTPGDGDGVLSPGGGPEIPPPAMTCPTFSSGTQTIMGLETRIVAGTPSADHSGPLLIYWHGTGSNPAFELNVLPQSMRDEITSAGGMIVAAHDPANGPAREGTDVTGGGVWFTTHDFAFADLIVACAVQNHGIDPKRIYTTGCSAGGIMAGQMELKHGSYLAAVSANSGGLASPYGATAPTRVPPTLLMYGDPSKDKVSLGTFTFEFETPSNNLANLLKGGGGFVIKCKHDEGHCQAPADLQAAAWQFMKDHPYGTTGSPYAASGLPSSFPSYCEIVQ